MEKFRLQKVIYNRKSRLNKNKSYSGTKVSIKQKLEKKNL